jgi:hypothetical protein
MVMGLSSGMAWWWWGFLRHGVVVGGSDMVVVVDTLSITVIRILFNMMQMARIRIFTPRHCQNVLILDLRRRRQNAVRRSRRDQEIMGWKLI